jgi:hypothetical protein
MDVVELLPLVLSDRSNQVVDAWDQDLSLGRNELGHWILSAVVNRKEGGKLTDEDQVCHGLVDGSTESTRVEIPVGSRDLDLVVVDTSETVGQIGGLGVKPVVV